MFKKVEFDKLVSGKKYRIYNKWKGIYIGRIDSFWIQFTNVYSLENVYSGDRLLTIGDYYSEFIPQKEKAQLAMEKRALLIILRRLIGDEHFTWYQ